MERETDCKIAIRGKGSVKEGARRGPTAVDADDELHVYISGESEEAVEKARWIMDAASELEIKLYRVQLNCREQKNTDNHYLGSGIRHFCPSCRAMYLNISMHSCVFAGIYVRAPSIHVFAISLLHP